MNLKFICKIELKFEAKNLCFINKRYMFKRGGNIENLKKSGDLISTAETKIIINTASNNTGGANLRSLDLVNNHEKLQQCIIERKSASTTVISIKDINKGVVYPIRVNRNLALYGKINKNFNCISSKDNIFEKSSFIKYKAECIANAEIALKEKKLKTDQFLVFIKRLEALDLSYIHAVIGDIANLHKNVDQNQDSIKIIYHVITTKAAFVDYGGPNKFNPIFLYKNVDTGINYYTIPLTYVLTLKKEEYTTYFLSKNKEAFKNDTIDIQTQLASSIKSVSEINTFKMFDINEKCFNTLPSNIIPDEVFPDSIYNRDITRFVPEIPFLLD